jgi:hypothetical protein
MSRADGMLLVAILARRDALFWPWRFQIGNSTPLAEIRRRQREYLEGVAGIAVKADGRGDWKNAHEMRQRLINAGMVAATHSGGQVTSVFLTPLGEAYARALVGDRLHTVESAEPVFIYLKILSDLTPDKAVRESVLFNRDCVGCPNDWDPMTEHLLPFLTSGMVRQDSDTEGRACYTPVDGAAEPEMIAVNVAADDAFDTAYVKAFNAERQTLESCEPRDPHEIYIPLPASGWGWPIHFEEANHEQK